MSWNSQSTRLVLNSQRSACLCFQQSARIKSMGYHCLALFCIFLSIRKCISYSLKETPDSIKILPRELIEHHLGQSNFCSSRQGCRQEGGSGSFNRVLFVSILWSVFLAATQFSLFQVVSNRILALCQAGWEGACCEVCSTQPPASLRTF